MRTRFGFLGAFMALCLLPAGAQALTITLSDMSSEPITNPFGDLLADVTFTVSNCGATCDLSIVLDNRTDENGNGVTYDMNQLGFNATFAVFNSADLTYVSATHSVNGAVTGGWSFFEEDAVDDADTHLDGFGIFDFALMDGTGNSLAQVNPGTQVTFLFTAPGGISDADFFAQSGQTTGGTNTLKLVAAKFVDMDPIGSFTCGPSGTGACDSAFGATAIPEPGTGLLLSMGLLGLVAHRRRR
jgi:hypothetical protein